MQPIYLSVIANHIKSRVLCQMNLYFWVLGMSKHLPLLHVMQTDRVGKISKIAVKIYLRLGTIFPMIITLKETFSKVSQTIGILLYKSL